MMPPKDSWHKQQYDQEQRVCSEDSVVETCFGKSLYLLFPCQALLQDLFPLKINLAMLFYFDLLYLRILAKYILLKWIFIHCHILILLSLD